MTRKMRRFARALPWRLRWRYALTMLLYAWTNGHVVPRDTDHREFMAACERRLQVARWRDRESPP